MTLSDPLIMHRQMTLAAPHTLAAGTSKGNWVAYPHLAFLSRTIALEIATANANFARDPDHHSGARLIINMGPRMGKSELISHWLQTWYMTLYPHHNLMMISHSANLAEKWGRAVRDDFTTNPELGVKVRGDVASVSSWMTEQGGGMLSAGIGTGVMGFGFHLGTIDDPSRDFDEAFSPMIQKGICDWYDAVFYTRKMPGAHIIVLMQRWNSFDLTAYLTKRHPDPWKVIRLPSLAEAGDPMGRKPGEPLCPKLVTINDLRQFEKANKPIFDAMHQQNPAEELADRAYDHYTAAGNLDKAVRVTRHDLPLRLTMDFNVNPGMHAHICQYDPRDDMATVYQEIHGHRMKTEAVMDEFEKWVIGQGGWKWPEGIIVHGDRSGRTETTNTADTDYHIIMNKLELMAKRHGWPINKRLCVPMANPPVKFRVDTVNEALRDSEGIVHVRINPLTCPRLVNDLEFVMKDEKGLPDKETDKSLTHGSDSIGYFLIWVRPVRRLKFKEQRQVTT